MFWKIYDYFICISHVFMSKISFSQNQRANVDFANAEEAGVEDRNPTELLSLLFGREKEKGTHKK